MMGAPVFMRQIHDLDDLLRIRFRERSAKHRKILRKNKYRAAMDQTVAGDKAVAINDSVLHAEVLAAMSDELVQFFKGSFVEQLSHAFAG